MKPEIIHGDLLEQDVEVIVNAWNRNIVPWWLLLPQGVSASIKKKAGIKPFRELARMGPIPAGGAVVTSPGNLPYRAIIHVAGITMAWVATRRTVQDSVRNAISIVNDKGFLSVAFPVIGSGSGNRSGKKALAWMLDAFEAVFSDAKCFIVVYDREKT